MRTLFYLPISHYFRKDVYIMNECKHWYIGECIDINIQFSRGILNAGGSALVMYECKHCCICNAGGSALGMQGGLHWF